MLKKGLISTFYTFWFSHSSYITSLFSMTLFKNKITLMHQIKPPSFKLLPLKKTPGFEIFLNNFHF